MSKQAPAIPLSALNQDNSEDTQRLADEQINHDLEEADKQGLPEGFGKPHADADADTSIAAQAERATEENESEQRVPLARVREITRQKHEAQESARAHLADVEKLRAELDALRKPNIDRDFDAEISALTKAFNDDTDDELTHDVFIERLSALNMERGRAEQAAASYAESTRKAAEALNKDWSAAEAAFLEVNPIYTTNKAHLASLNAYVAEVAAEDKTLTPDEIMDEAHKRVSKDLGETALTQKQLVERARTIAAATAAAATATLPAMPQGGMGSRSTGTEIDMEAMTPDRWAKMSQAERDKALGIAASA